MGDANHGSEGDTGRVCALDYGRARIGVAISDELGMLAHPRPFVGARPPGRAVAELSRLASREGVAAFVVGLPRNMDGSEGASARAARQFASRLEDTTGLPVTLIDERLSTVEAQSRLHEAGRNTKSSRTRIDSASAAVLLQSWLDSRRGGAP